MSYFVDTNVLVYARDAADAEKQRQAHQWLEYLWRNRTGQLSFQVLQEYYVTVTQKLDPGMDSKEARDDVHSFEAWRPLVVDNRVLTMAWDVQDRFGFSWWDALIVAAADLASCEFLLTEDLQHEQRLGPLTVINPFRAQVPA